jgi:single-strand DNA-binding protein
MTGQPRSTSTAASGSDPVNEVRLTGRLGARPTLITLPSGDEVLTFRVVVPRGPGDRRPPTVDTVDCSVWSRGMRRRAGSWAEGDEVAVVGRLRRRFWRGPGGLRSRYEVDVRQGRRLRRGGANDAA